MHQDLWASEISLFSVVSTCVEGSVCPRDCWQSPASSPTAPTTPACWLLFDLLIIFLHFVCHILVSLALQSSVTKGVEIAFSTSGAKSVCPPGLLSMCHVVLWTKSWLGPNRVAVIDRPLCYLMLGIIKIFIFLVGWCCCLRAGNKLYQENLSLVTLRALGKERHESVTLYTLLMYILVFVFVFPWKKNKLEIAFFLFVLLWVRMVWGFSPLDILRFCNSLVITDYVPV